MAIPKDQRIVIGKMIRLFKEFREIDPKMLLGEIITLLHISLNEEVTLDFLSAELGIEGISVPQRYTARLGEFEARRKEPGFDLITSRIDPMNNRRRFRNVTPKGQSLINRAIRAIGE